MTRILLVEDDAAQLKRLQEFLQGELTDCEFIGAGNLRGAKDRIQQLRAFSLVIADYQLPDGTGYDLLEYCQGRLTNVPFIIITAFGKHEAKEVRAARSLQKGAFDFWNKSTGQDDLDELVERIKHALKIGEALA